MTENNENETIYYEAESETYHDMPDNTIADKTTQQWDIITKLSDHALLNRDKSYIQYAKDTIWNYFINTPNELKSYLKKNQLSSSDMPLIDDGSNFITIYRILRKLNFNLDPDLCFQIKNYCKDEKGFQAFKNELELINIDDIIALINEISIITQSRTYNMANNVLSILPYFISLPQSITSTLSTASMLFNLNFQNIKSSAIIFIIGTLLQHRINNSETFKKIAFEQNKSKIDPLIQDIMGAKNINITTDNNIIQLGNKIEYNTEGIILRAPIYTDNLINYINQNLDNNIAKLKKNIANDQAPILINSGNISPQIESNKNQNNNNIAITNNKEIITDQTRLQNLESYKSYLKFFNISKLTKYFATYSSLSLGNGMTIKNLDNLHYSKDDDKNINLKETDNSILFLNLPTIELLNNTLKTLATRYANFLDLNPDDIDRFLPTIVSNLNSFIHKKLELDTQKITNIEIKDNSENDSTRIITLNLTNSNKIIIKISNDGKIEFSKQKLKVDNNATKYIDDTLLITLHNGNINIQEDNKQLLNFNRNILRDTTNRVNNLNNINIDSSLMKDLTQGLPTNFLTNILTDLPMAVSGMELSAEENHTKLKIKPGTLESICKNLQSLLPSINFKKLPTLLSDNNFELNIFNNNADYKPTFIKKISTDSKTTDSFLSLLNLSEIFKSSFTESPMLKSLITSLIGDANFIEKTISQALKQYGYDITGPITKIDLVDNTNYIYLENGNTIIFTTNSDKISIEVQKPQENNSTTSFKIEIQDKLLKIYNNGNEIFNQKSYDIRNQFLINSLDAAINDKTPLLTKIALYLVKFSLCIGSLLGVQYWKKLSIFPSSNDTQLKI